MLMMSVGFGRLELAPRGELEHWPGTWEGSAWQAAVVDQRWWVELRLGCWGAGLTSSS